MTQAIISRRINVNVTKSKRDETGENKFKRHLNEKS